MNNIFVPLVRPINIVLLSLSLILTVVVVNVASAAGVKIDIEAAPDMTGITDNRLFPSLEADINEDKYTSPAGQNIIHLPLLTQGYREYPVERAALMALYNNTNGYGWINNNGWGTDTMYCNWYGVYCDDHGHVKVIGLDWNGLTGHMPPEIGDLANLQELDLRGNELVSIPPEIGDLVNLKWLCLQSNLLSSLPPEVGNLDNLQWLYLYSNQLYTLLTKVTPCDLKSFSR